MRPLVSLLVLFAALPAAAQGSSPPKSEKTARALVQEAEASLASGDWDKAVALATKALEIAPEDAAALEIGGFLTAAAGRFDEADRMLARACGLRPERPECFVRLGDAKAERAKFCAGRRDDACVADASGAALSAYREALRLGPDSLGAKRGIAIALLTAGHIEESIEAHEAWISASADRREAVRSLASAFAEAEDWDELTGLMGRFAESDPDLSGEIGLRILGLLYESGRRDELTGLMERFAESDPDLSGQIGLRILGLLYESGRREEGDALAKRLLKGDPPEVRRLGLQALDDAIHRSYDRALNGLVRYLAAGPRREEAEILYNAVVDRGPKMKGVKLDPPKGGIYEESASGIALPSVIHKSAPVYPDGLRRQRVEGKAIIMAVVRTDGTIGRVTLLSATHPAFGVAALDAVKQWRYKPATENGRPVAMYYTIRADFRLR